MRKKLYITCIFVLILITGCNSQKEVKKEKQTNELNYNGTEIIHICSDDELSLFKEKVKVTVIENQSFTLVDNNYKFKDYTEGEHIINEINDIKNCFFVNYGEVSNNKFGSTTPINIKDSKYGTLQIEILGNYSYKVINSKDFANSYKDLEYLNQLLRNNIINVYSSYVSSKSYYDILKKISFNSNELNKLNEKIKMYGIEITKVNIECIKLTESSEEKINNYIENQLNQNNTNSSSNETLVSQIVVDIYILSKEEGGRHTPFFSDYKPILKFNNKEVNVALNFPDGVEMVMPGTKLNLTLTLEEKINIKTGDKIELYEVGKKIGEGTVLRVK